MHHNASRKTVSFLYRIATRPICVALCLTLLPLATLTVAADQSVTNTAATGAGSLPQAVADVGTGEDVIFESDVAGQTINLSSSLNVTRSMNFINNTNGIVTVEFDIRRITASSGVVIGLSEGATFKTVSSSVNDITTIFGVDSFTINDLASDISTVTEQGEFSTAVSGMDITITNGVSGNIFVKGCGMATGIRAGNTLNITGGITGTITAENDVMDSNGIVANQLTIDGGISGTISATACDTGAASGIRSADLVISGGISGVISARSGLFVNGVLASGTINGGDASTPLVIDGNVIAECYSTGSRSDAIAIQGSGVNLKLGATGRLSAVAYIGDVYAILSTGTATDKVELVAGCTVVGDINLGDGTSDILTLSGADGTTTYDGDISGVETINITGGNWHLNGQLGGDLNISGGSFGGTAGIGSLTVNGTVAPGNSIGTLTVGGDYTQNVGSTLEIEINAAGQSDLVDVTGSATINGGAVEVQAESGLYTSGATYTMVSAAGGVTGTFDSLSDNLTFFDTSLVYNTNDIQISLGDRIHYATVAETSNQRNVARFLDDRYTSASGDFATVLAGFNTLSASEARTAFDSLSGELYGSISTVGIENTDRFLRTIASRLRVKSFSGRFQYSMPESVERGDGDEPEVARGQGPFGGVRVNRWLPWFEGYGIGANIASDGNASGLDYSGGGVTYGIEDELDEQTLFGFVAGYSQTSLNLDARDDHGKIKSTQLGLYLNHHNDLDYMTGIVAYGYNAYDTWRHVQIGSLARLTRAESEGSEFSFYLETGQNYQYRSVFLQPFAALQYIQLHQDGFGEMGADSVNLNIAGIGTDSFRSLLGTRVMSCYPGDFGKTLTLEGRAFWRHEFLGGARVVDAQFAGQPGSSFAISGLTIDRDSVLLGGGVNYGLSKDAKIYINYDLLFSQNYAAHAGSAGLMLAW